MGAKAEKTTGLPPLMQRVQERLLEAHDREKNIFDGAVLVDLEIDCDLNNTKRVSHRLGRRPKGIILVHWSREGLAENWTLQTTDMTRWTIELQVYNDSASGIYRLKVLVF